MTLYPGLPLACAVAALSVALAAPGSAAPASSTVPRVRTATPGAGSLVLDKTTTITVSSETLRPHADVLKRDLLHLAGIAATVAPGLASVQQQAAGPPNIALQLNATMQDSDNAYYEYELSVTTTGATAMGGSVPAVAHATATLLQQLRPTAVGAATVSATAITDWSTVQWTGFMYDLARDPVDTLTMKDMIDLCRFYKMRFMHIFATAEQGWRLPIPKWMNVSVPPVFQVRHLICHSSLQFPSC